MWNEKNLSGDIKKLKKVVYSLQDRLNKANNKISSLQYEIRAKDKILKKVKKNIDHLVDKKSFEEIEQC